MSKLLVDSSNKSIKDIILKQEEDKRILNKLNKMNAKILGTK